MVGRGVLSHGANSQADSSGQGKRSVKRAIRGFFFWGRSIFRGKWILEWRDLVRNFPLQIIAQVRGEVAVQRHYWALQMSGSTTDDEFITQRLDLGANIQQAWESAHMQGLVKDVELQKQTKTYESTLSGLLARPKYQLPPMAPPAKATV